MEPEEALALVESAVDPHVGTWADLGAGRGTFTRALATVLAPGSRVYAVDSDPSAVEALARIASRPGVEIVPVVADFTKPFDFPALADAKLDGLLFANALHFVGDVEQVLARLVERVRAGGRVVVIEYDRRAASRWVPYPLSPGRLERIAASTGLSKPRVTRTVPSMYSGTIYVAACELQARANPDIE